MNDFTPIQSNRHIAGTLELADRMADLGVKRMMVNAKVYKLLLESIAEDSRKYYLTKIPYKGIYFVCIGERKPYNGTSNLEEI